MAKPKGFFKHFLGVDVETSGLAMHQPNPGINLETNETYQIVSIGLIVVDSQTLKIVEEDYIEIKWNGTSVWNDRAQAVHGLSKDYLEKNGVSEQKAVEQICTLILKYFGPTGTISLMGHNVATFDKCFLDNLCKKFDIALNFSHRCIDTNSIGFANFTTFTSDELFEQLGLGDRDIHNALEDIKMSLKVVKYSRMIIQQAIGDI